MARLTRAQRRLLTYPPTVGTWTCDRVLKTEPCPGINASGRRTCWVCLRPKPRNAHLLYPEYLTACKRAGIEPGDRWRDPDDAAAIAVARAEARRKKK